MLPSAISNYSQAARSPYYYHGARHGIQVPRLVGSEVNHMQVRVEECVLLHISLQLPLPCTLPAPPAPSSQLPAPLHLRPAHAAPRSLSSRPPYHTPLGPNLLLAFPPVPLAQREGPLKAKSLGSTTRCRLGECCCCISLGQQASGTSVCTSGTLDLAPSQIRSNQSNQID